MLNTPTKQKQPKINRFYLKIDGELKKHSFETMSRAYIYARENLETFQFQTGLIYDAAEDIAYTLQEIKKSLKKNQSQHFWTKKTLEKTKTNHGNIELNMYIQHITKKIQYKVVEYIYPGGIQTLFTSKCYFEAKDNYNYNS